MSPLDPANPIYCILIWSVYTMYVSGKLGQGGTFLKIEKDDKVMTLFFKVLTGNKFA